MREEMHEYICGAWDGTRHCDHSEQFINEETATQQLYRHLRDAHNVSTDRANPSRLFFGWVIPFRRSTSRERRGHWLGGDPTSV